MDHNNRNINNNNNNNDSLYRMSLEEMFNHLTQQQQELEMKLQQDWQRLGFNFIPQLIPNELPQMPPTLKMPPMPSLPAMDRFPPIIPDTDDEEEGNDEPAFELFYDSDGEIIPPWEPDEEELEERQRRPKKIKDNINYPNCHVDNTRFKYSFWLSRFGVIGDIIDYILINNMRTTKSWTRYNFNKNILSQPKIKSNKELVKKIEKMLDIFDKKKRELAENENNNNDQ